VGNEHPRLFAEHNALGVHASVYNFIAKTWIAPSEPADDLEGGKERAAAPAQEYLKRVGEFGTAASALEGIAIRVVSIGSVGQLLQHALGSLTQNHALPDSQR